MFYDQSESFQALVAFNCDYWTPSFWIHPYFINAGAHQQLQEYEKKLFGSVGSSLQLPVVFSPAAGPHLSFGFPKTNDIAPLPAFGCTTTPSIFSRAPSDIAPTNFTFGAGQNVTGSSPFNTNPSNPNVTDIQMDGSWFSNQQQHLCVIKLLDDFWLC